MLTCTRGIVRPESTTTITIVLVAPLDDGHRSLNTVTVDPNNAIFEADETNNIATQDDAGRHRHRPDDPQDRRAPGFDPIATNGTQTYTITVDNIGTAERHEHPRARHAARRHALPLGGRRQRLHLLARQRRGGLRRRRDPRAPPAEFYPPFGAPGDDTATITIRVFAQPTVGTGVNGMHNEVRVDPFNEIAEVNEANNIDFEDTDVGTGGAAMGAFNQLTIAKTQVSPANPVARNAVVTYRIVVGNDGTDPALDVPVRDFLPAGVALHRGDRHEPVPVHALASNFVELRRRHRSRPAAPRRSR